MMSPKPFTIAILGPTLALTLALSLLPTHQGRVEAVPTDFNNGTIATGFPYIPLP